MIVRLIDRKGFSKVIEYTNKDFNIRISIPVSERKTKVAAGYSGEIDIPDFKVIDFEYSGKYDHERLPIFEEI
jgi:hypothetical protein